MAEEEDEYEERHHSHGIISRYIGFREFLTLLILALVIWAGNSINESSKAMIGMVIKVDNIKETVDGLKKDFKDRFTGDDAIIQFGNVNKRIDGIQKEVDELDGRMTANEKEDSKVHEKINSQYRYKANGG